MTDQAVRVKTSEGWQDLAITGPAGPVGGTGPTGPAGPTGPSGGRIFYFAPSDPSDIATYKTILQAPSAGPEQTVAVVCTGTGDISIGNFVTDPGVPGVVDYPAGTTVRRIYAKTSAGTARLHLQIYVRNAAGTETLVRDEYSDPFTDTTVALQEWIISPSSAGAMDVTDRIVAKLFAQRVSGSASITVTAYFEGSSHVSQIQSTISTGAQGPVGPTGPPGPAGEVPPSATVTRSILDVGISNHTRAGRVLTAADFTALGLSTPLGLWNLTTVADSSGNGRNFTNKGTVTFGTGITGATPEAAIFTGSTAQALYITDTGSSDPFRIKTGSWGCWFRTAKTGTAQYILCKTASSGADASSVFGLSVSTSNYCVARALTAIATNTVGTTNVCDDRWHFAVATWDGTITRLYIDGNLETLALGQGQLNDQGAPLNIGGYGADGSTAAGQPFYGRVDEAFITSDILSLEQVRMLYAVKVPHTLTGTPTKVTMTVNRYRRGAPLVAADFPTQPLRLYNFVGGALTDLGSNNATLTNNNSSVAVAGVDGTATGAFLFNGTNQYLSATDTGLPSGTASRSIGFWVKTVSSGVYCVSYGSPAGTRTLIYVTTPGLVASYWDGSTDCTGTHVIYGGTWRFIVVTAENAPADGLKRKLYVDGQLSGVATTLASNTLGGAGFFTIAKDSTAAAYMPGTFANVFVCDYVLTPEQINKLFAKGSQLLPDGPKDASAHIEAIDTTNLYVTGDTLDSQNTIDLSVA